MVKKTKIIEEIKVQQKKRKIQKKKKILEKSDDLSDNEAILTDKEDDYCKTTHINNGNKKKMSFLDSDGKKNLLKKSEFKKIFKIIYGQGGKANRMAKKGLNMANKYVNEGIVNILENADVIRRCQKDDGKETTTMFGRKHLISALEIEGKNDVNLKKIDFDNLDSDMCNKNCVKNISILLNKK